MNRFIIQLPVRISVLCGILLGMSLLPEASTAQEQERGSVCVVSREAKASLHVDPWAKETQVLKRFGAVENSDEVSIQSCKGVTGQYLALTIGNRESSLASDSGNVVLSQDLGLERCEYTPGIKKIPWLISQTDRENSIRSRIKTLRSCVALRVTSLNGRPLVLGNHPPCTWTSAGPVTYVARGFACTLKIETNTAIAVSPMIEESCLKPDRFESGELQSADLDTMLQTFVTSDEKAFSSGTMIGATGRRIVFAPSPKVAAYDVENELRFPKTLNLKIQPTSVNIATERSKDEATSFVSMQMMVRNIGSKSSSFPVPLAAEAELIELSKDSSGQQAGRTVSNWMVYASGQTLVPADWSGLFVTDRAEIPDYAFKHGRRYRIKLKYYHPHDVPGLLQAEFRNRPQTFSINLNSFDIQKFPTLNLLAKVPQFSGFPRLGRGPQDHQPGNQISATETEILQFFRKLGLDEAFPARYNKLCGENDDSGCVDMLNATFFGQSIIDFTADMTPGQVSQMRAVSIDSHTKLMTDKTASSLHFEERQGIECK